MIRSYIEGKWIEFDNLTEALNLDYNEQTVISIVGAGGKTTVIRRLQKEYTDLGIANVVATTTHIQQLNTEWYMNKISSKNVKSVLNKYKKAWIGTLEGNSNDEKKQYLKDIIKLGCNVFIEADGAKMLSCKAPEAHEPVILPETDMVLSIYGLDAIGKSLQEKCFRLERVMEILGKNADEILTSDDVAMLASSDCGGKKSVAKHMDYQVILNKANGIEELNAAKMIAEQLWMTGMKRIHVVSDIMPLEWKERV